MLSSIRIVQKQLFRNVARSSVITIERELMAEVVGETKVCITVHPQSFEEEWPFRDESSSHEHGHRSAHEQAKGHMIRT